MHTNFDHHFRLRILIAFCLNIVIKTHGSESRGSGVARPGPTRACALPSTFQALPSAAQQIHVIS